MKARNWALFVLTMFFLLVFAISSSANTTDEVSLYLPLIMKGYGATRPLDVVLVIDISESMSWDAPQGDEKRDPYKCNHPELFIDDEIEPKGINEVFTQAEIDDDPVPGECQPFEKAKTTAADFAARILDKSETEEEDRLAIVTFANGWSDDVDEGTHVRTAGWTSNLTTTLNIINDDVKVFEPGECVDDACNFVTPYGACRLYNYPCVNNSNYAEGAYIPDLYCLSCNDSGEYSSKTSTNIGGGLKLAGNMYDLDVRQDSVWVVVLLTDGMANATDLDVGDDITDVLTYPIGYCPNDSVYPFCQDEDVSTRHSIFNPNLYDADDYARDMANYVGCLSVDPAPACGGLLGQGVEIFTIGLWAGVLDNTNEATNKPYGAELLRYIAAVGDDGDPLTDPCSGEDDYQAWCGNYYYADSDVQLNLVIENIIDRLLAQKH